MGGRFEVTYKGKFLDTFTAPSAEDAKFQASKYKKVWCFEYPPNRNQRRVIMSNMSVKKV